MSAVKSTSGSAVSTGTWSNETLKYTITSTGTHSSGVTIKYCVDTKNTCTPSTTIVSGKAFNLSNTGTYYVRYQGTTGAGKTNSIASYKAMVDTVAPTVSYSLAGGTYNENKTVRVTVNDTNFKSMSVYVFKNKALVYTNKIASKSIDNTTKNTFDVLLDEDGDWTIYTKATDAASNEIVQKPINGNKFYYQTYVINSCMTKDDSGDYIKDKKNGDLVQIAGYNWHVIWDDGEKMAFLMDVKQNKKTECNYGQCTDTYYTLTMSHESSSWESSKINNYLNTTFLNELTNNGLNINSIYESSVCDTEHTSAQDCTLLNPDSSCPSIGTGYLKDELERTYVNQYGNIQKVGSCKAGTYTLSKVRMLSYVEARNLNAHYNGEDKIQGNSYMNNYSSPLNKWYLTPTGNDSNPIKTTYAGTLITGVEVQSRNSSLTYEDGNAHLYSTGDYGEESFTVVRPVIVLYKNSCN